MCGKCYFRSESKFNVIGGKLQKIKIKNTEFIKYMFFLIVF